MILEGLGKSRLVESSSAFPCSRSTECCSTHFSRRSHLSIFFSFFFYHSIFLYRFALFSSLSFSFSAWEAVSTSLLNLSPFHWFTSYCFNGYRTVRVGKIFLSPILFFPCPVYLAFSLFMHRSSGRRSLAVFFHLLLLFIAVKFYNFLLNCLSARSDIFFSFFLYTTKFR